MDTLHLPEACSKVPAVLHEGFSWTLARLAQAVIGLQNEALGEHGLTLRSYAVLATVSERTPRTQLEIAQVVGLDKSTLVATIDDLERRRLVERRADPADRRARVVEATAEGRALAVKAAETVARTETHLLGEFRVEEAARIRDSLVGLLSGALHIDAGRRGSCC